MNERIAGEPAAGDRSRADRIAGGLHGLLIGDAMGVPYEFHPAARIPALPLVDMVPPQDFPRAHPATPPGTWSDDGAQALCLLESLLECDGLQLEDFALRMLRWFEDGHLAVDARVFDVGLQTQRAFRALREGAAADVSGPAGENANGNGSLMRVLPLVLWHRSDDADLIGCAAQQSLPTHGHPRAQVCCAMYCLWARNELHGQQANSWDLAAARLRDLGAAQGLPLEEIEYVLDPVNRCEASGSGYVLDTLWSARIALDESTDYATAVRRAIAFGNDTDTTAAVVGGMAGIRHGRSGVPAPWRSALRGRELLDPLCDRLLRVATGQG